MKSPLVRPGDDVDIMVIRETFNFRQKLTVALKNHYSEDMFDVVSKMLERDSSHRVTAKVIIIGYGLQCKCSWHSIVVC